MISPETTPLTVTVQRADGAAIARRYSGTIVSAPVGGRLALVNNVDLEAYVASVLASEVSPSWHPEMLKAQAVAVRTYALRRMRHARPATYDVVDDTSNQVYRGLDGIVDTLTDAANATTGQALIFEGAPVDVWYHSACGGHTAGSDEITGAAAPSYLRGVADSDAGGRAYCALSPYYKWRNTLSSADIARVANVDAATLSGLAVAERWSDGRVKTIRAQTSDGAAHDLDGHAFYSRAGAVLGYKVLPSSLFDIDNASSGAFAFSGHGVGHGVGMCQWGAEGRARSGMSSAAILSAYFPGTALTSTAPSGYFAHRAQLGDVAGRTR